MAVIQISKIQVRRGLQENLPQLASGEFGWSVDEGKLWIGNGTLSEGAPEEGNTEILTSRSAVLRSLRYIFEGGESGYTSITGPSILSYVTRRLQDKLDDIVNFRDFITPEDETSGNYTAALQRAIDQIFPMGYNSDEVAGVRRVLKIPAGQWQISNITVPPFATLQGDGKFSTILYSNIAPALGVPVVEVRDSRGNIGNLSNASTSILPSHITFNDLMIKNTTSANLVLLQSANNIKFNDIAFIGANTAPVAFPNSEALTYGVGIGPTVAYVKNVHFNGCTFANTHFGIVGIFGVYDVSADQCKFENLTVAIYGEGTGAAQGDAPQMRVINSHFTDIAEAAIGSFGDTSISSGYNYFDRVGYGDGNQMDSGTPVHPVFSWQNPSNYSVGDIFSRTAAEEDIVPIYAISNTQPVGTYVSYSASGTLRTSTGYTLELPSPSPGNTITTTSSVMVLQDQSSTIDYRIERLITGNLESRIGSVKITHLNGNYFYDNEYTETANIVVWVDYTTSGNGIALTFTTGSTGANSSPAYASYSARTFY